MFELFSLSKTTIFMTHGHNYSVKNNLHALYGAARSLGADLVLYGHTHVAHFEFISGMYVLNPGAACSGNAPSWAQIELSAGIVQCRIVPFD